MTRRQKPPKSERTTWHDVHVEYESLIHLLDRTFAVVQAFSKRAPGQGETVMSHAEAANDFAKQLAGLTNQIDQLNIDALPTADQEVIADQYPLYLNHYSKLTQIYSNAMTLWNGINQHMELYPYE